MPDQSIRIVQDASSRPAWKWAFWLLAALAFCTAASRVFLFVGFNNDKVMQIAAAQSLLDGKGLTVAPDLGPRDALRRQPLVLFPAGYSVVFAACAYVCGDYETTSAVLDAIFLLLFCGAWAVILERLRGTIGKPTQCLIWLWWALIWNPMGILTSAEKGALAAFSWSIAGCLLSVSRPRSLAWSTLSAVSAVAAATFRYAYWPLVAASPLALAGAALASDRRRQLLGAAVLQGGVAALLLAALALAQRGLSGHVTYLSTDRITDWSLYWEHLLRWDPFPAYVVNFWPIWHGLSVFVVRGLQVVSIDALSWFVSGIVVVIAVAPVVKHRQRAFDRHGRGSTAQERLDADTIVVFTLGGLAASALTMAMLGYLSLRVPYEIAPRLAADGLWTFVQETRYYAPALVYLSVAFLGSVGNYLFDPCANVYPARRRAAQLALIGWALLAVPYAFKDPVVRLCDPRAQAEHAQQRRTSQVVREWVRRQDAAGQLTIFVYPHPKQDYHEVKDFAARQARMGGAFLLTETVAATREPAGQPCVYLGLALREGADSTLQAMQRVSGTSPVLIADFGQYGLYLAKGAN